MFFDAAERKTALVTGASSGIGFALARELAHDGFNLVLVARHEDVLLLRAAELTTSTGVEAMVIPADLSLPTGPIEVCRELEYHGVRVDVLVNNAGFGVHGYFAATDWQRELEMMSLNMLGLTRLTKLLLGPMLSRGSGRILNVASTAAFEPGPLMAVYYATKAYILSFSEALHEELRGSGVTVTVLCPGPTRTKFQERANLHHLRLMRGHLADPAVVARVGVAGMLGGKAVVVPLWRNKLGVALTRLLPRPFVRRLVRWLGEEG